MWSVVGLAEGDCRSDDGAGSRRLLVVSGWRQLVMTAERIGGKGVNHDDHSVSKLARG